MMPVFIPKPIKGTEISLTSLNSFQYVPWNYQFGWVSFAEPLSGSGKKVSEGNQVAIEKGGAEKVVWPLDAKCLLPSVLGKRERSLSVQVCFQL